MVCEVWLPRLYTKLILLTKTINMVVVTYECLVSVAAISALEISQEVTSEYLNF